jgi:hypothetical protein
VGASALADSTVCLWCLCCSGTTDVADTALFTVCELSYSGGSSSSSSFCRGCCATLLLLLASSGTAPLVMSRTGACPATVVRDLSLLSVRSPPLLLLLLLCNAAAAAAAAAHPQAPPPW